MSEDILRQGLDTIHAALSVRDNTIEYRVVGAGAVWAMGMAYRGTADFDIVVQNAEAIKARRILLQHNKFGKSSLNSLFIHIGTKYYNVDILTTSRSQLSIFPPGRYDQHVTMAIIAPIDSMLETKIGAYRNPERKASKRSTDESDIAFLLDIAAQKAMAFGFDSIVELDKAFSASFRSRRRECEKSLDLLGCALE
ncbi:hypothetical protein IAQ61_005447 [Plenodomus lingam]|nr:hypothetical protein IAQ61_005447 [Plenodomus lingam]